MPDARAATPPAAVAWCVITWGLAFAYATLRYVVLGPVPAAQIPLFIVNKSLSFASIALFSATYLLRRGALARPLGQAATWMIFTHVQLSLVLLAAGGFKALYAAPGALSVRGQLVLLFGVIGASALAWQYLQPTHRLVRAARLAVLLLAVLHTLAMGAPGWITPGRWYGGLPPITMLSTACGAVGLFFALLRRGDPR